MNNISIKEILATEDINKDIFIQGWVRTRRGSKRVNFIALNDGSTIQNLQIVADVEKIGDKKLNKISTGTSIAVKGKIISSKGSGQKVEILADEIRILGLSNPDKYPLQPKKHSLEFLREIAHLRFRTSTFGAVFHIRHGLSFAIHKYFHERGFYYLHTPIITASDAEGAGEMFRVTTLDAKNPPLIDGKNVDYSKDFFGLETKLTVSGQLQGELGAMGLGKIYTFAPTFRAENSNTARHLAEFWMIEPEMAFYDLKDNIDLAEDFLKYLIQFVLDNYMEDLQFLSRRQQDEEKTKKADERSPELIEKLHAIINTEFVRLSYTDAFEILKNSRPNKKNRFEYPVKQWGLDIQAEHERFLVEKHFKKPVILTDYPKEIKAFYMKQNPDDKTVAAVDILFPQIGEIIGGSQREENYDALKKRMLEMKIPINHLQWYLDTRLFGTVVHSGFGLGLERFVQFVAGMHNIRDVIPFPRTPQNARF